MIQTTQLIPGVTLRVFPDSRFKQNCLTVQFVRPMRGEEAAYNALLPAVLLRGCEGATDLQAITQQLDDLYGAGVGVLVRRVGDYQTTGLSCGFISDRFALEGDQILAPMAEFLYRLLRKPLTERGAFREDYVQSEKKNLIASIQARKNDKRLWCSEQMLKHMCREDSFGLSRLGEVGQVEAITPQSLYSHYQRVLSESPVELCFVGQCDRAALEKALLGLFQDLPRRVSPLPAQTPFRSAGGGEHTKTMDIAQGKLCVGFYTPITLRQGDLAAMQVCNTVLGGGMTSKLFVNVREKQSLCYDIGSVFYGSKGILSVSAGIDCDKKSHLLDQIRKELEDICCGRVTPEELAAAKQALITSLQSTHDTPGSIEGYYANGALSGLRLTPEEYIRELAAVDLDRVAAAAKSLHLDTVYFLKGER